MTTDHSMAHGRERNQSDTHSWLPPLDILVQIGYQSDKSILHRDDILITTPIKELKYQV